MSLIDLFKTATAAVKKGCIEPKEEFVIDSKESLQQAVQTFVDAQNRIDVAQSACDKILLKLQTKYMAMVMEDAALIAKLDPMIKQYVLDNKAMFPVGKKTLDLGVAKISYKDVPPTLIVSDEAEACAELLENGLWFVVRTRHTIVSEALKANWAKICEDYFEPSCISLSQPSESVTIKPTTVAGGGK